MLFDDFMDLLRSQICEVDIKSKFIKECYFMNLNKNPWKTDL
jgi:hypothetical protein